MSDHAQMPSSGSPPHADAQSGPPAMPQSLPPLTPDDAALLYTFLACGENPYTLAHQGHNFLDILAFTARPDINAWLAHARRLRTCARRENAFITLEHLLSATEDPIERRRIATTILRETNPRPRRSRPGRRRTSLGATAGAADALSDSEPRQAAFHTVEINASAPSAASDPSHPSGPHAPAGDNGAFAIINDLCDDPGDLDGDDGTGHIDDPDDDHPGDLDDDPGHFDDPDDDDRGGPVPPALHHFEGADDSTTSADPHQATQQQTDPSPKRDPPP